MPLPLPDPALSDGAVSLRPWRRDDLAPLLAGAADPLVHQFRYSLPADAAEGRAWLAATVADREHGRRLELAVCERGDDLAAGSISLWPDADHERWAGIGYWLSPVARGHGSATRAVRLLAGWAFATLDVQRLELELEVENRPSARVAERCGFTHESRLRSHACGRDGRWTDVDVYARAAGDRGANA